MLVRYTREDGCRAWLTHGVIHAETLTALLEEFGTAESIYDRFVASGGSFLKQYRVRDASISMLSRQASREKMHDMLLTMQKHGMGVLSQHDPQYPDALMHIPSPPALLFYRGDLDCLMGKCISVVGSRRASPQGIEMTRTICRDLSRAGVTVVSGFAMGVDTAAHEGCLEGGSPTAAVLGCGIDVDYPIENVALKEEIIRRGGVLLSEYPPGFRANRFVFQARNRIISGLGKALVMMESRIKSGSMLTVQHALDQGREVFAYPGTPGTEWAEGAHQLLREGANYFTSAQDLLEDLSWDDAMPVFDAAVRKELPPMTEEQRVLYQALGYGEMSFDQLVAQTGLSPAAITVSLTMLQMMGLVKAMPGKCYCRV